MFLYLFAIVKYKDKFIWFWDNYLLNLRFYGFLIKFRNIENVTYYRKQYAFRYLLCGRTILFSSSCKSGTEPCTRLSENFTLIVFTAGSTGNHTAERITFCCTVMIILGMLLFQPFLCLLKSVSVNNRFVCIFKTVFSQFSAIDGFAFFNMVVPVILLENQFSGIFFIYKNFTDSRIRPQISLTCWNAHFIEFICDFPLPMPDK